MDEVELIKVVKKGKKRSRRKVDQLVEASPKVKSPKRRKKVVAAVPKKQISHFKNRLKSKKQGAFQIVPWSSIEEWERVCENFNENRFAEVQEDLNVWKERMPALPVGVDATLYLIQAFINDPEKQPLGDLKNKVEISGDVLRSLYSLSIIRFLNHVSYTATSKADENDGAEASQITYNTLASLASKLGIPQWIVTLRNEASHGINIPSLEILRIAATFIQNWLKENYFCATGILTNPFSSNQPEEIELMPSSYLAARVYQYRKVDQITDEEILRQIKEFQPDGDEDSESACTLDIIRILQVRIESILESNPIALCTSLLFHFIPLKETNRINVESDEEDNLPSFYKQFLKVLLQNESNPDGFAQYYKLWRPIVKMLFKSGEIRTFFDLLIHQVGVLDFELSLCWIAQIFNEKNAFEYIGFQASQNMIKALTYNIEDGIAASQFLHILLPNISGFIREDTSKRLEELLSIQFRIEEEGDGGMSENSEGSLVKKLKPSGKIKISNGKPALFSLDQVCNLADSSNLKEMDENISWADIPLGAYLNKS